MLQFGEPGSKRPCTYSIKSTGTHGQVLFLQIIVIIYLLSFLADPDQILEKSFRKHKKFVKNNHFFSIQCEIRTVPFDKLKRHFVPFGYRA